MKQPKELQQLPEELQQHLQLQPQVFKGTLASQNEPSTLSLILYLGRVSQISTQ